jgi:hypothetical protein
MEAVMGEATYYCKIFFDSNQSAEQALPKIKAFLKQGVQAADFWHKYRDTTNHEKFWQDVDREFPEIGNYLRTAEVTSFHDKKVRPAFGGDHDNDLAGLLDFGDESDIDRMSVYGNIIRYSAYVWHFADWDPMLDFIKRRYGAERYTWLSDEYVDYFDLLT